MDADPSVGAAALAAAWEAASDAMALSDPDGIVLRANPAYYALYGYGADQVLGRSFAVIFPAAARADAEAQYRAVFAAAEVAPAYEATVRRADGAERVVEARHAFLEAGGRRVAMLSIVRDITPRAATEAALRASEERFRAFGAASSDLLWSRDAATMQFAYVSPAFAALYGVDPAAVAGRGDDLAGWAALLHPEDREAALAILGRVRAGERITHEFRVVRPADGAARWLRDTSFPIPDAAGRVGHVGGIARDITAEKRAAADRERLLDAERAARRLAEDTVRGRDEFLATAAHELRAPLARLRLSSQLLQLGDAVPAAARGETLATIERASVRLEALVRDLVDLARLRTGQLTLALGPVDLGALARDAVAEARQRDGVRHRYRLAVAPGLPAVEADPGRLLQVLANLLDNAAAYAPAGSTVAVALRREGEGVAVGVRDRGQGLAPGEAEAIFAPFARSAQTVLGQQQGLGLGLAIARGIVAQHEGRIAAASAGEGRGTTVTVWLPTAGPPEVGTG